MGNEWMEEWSDLVAEMPPSMIENFATAMAKAKNQQVLDDITAWLSTLDGDPNIGGTVQGVYDE